METNLKIPDCYLVADFKFIPPEPRIINLFEYLRCKNGSLVVGLQDGRMLEYDGEDMEIHIFNSKEIYFKDIGMIQTNVVLAGGGSFDTNWYERSHITDPVKIDTILKVFANLGVTELDSDNFYIFEH